MPSNRDKLPLPRYYPNRWMVGLLGQDAFSRLKKNRWAWNSGLLLIALVRLLQRDALDNEDVATLAQTDAKRQAGMAESTDRRRRAGRASRPDSAKRPHARRRRDRN